MGASRHRGTFGAVSTPTAETEIYHLAPASELRSGGSGGIYTPLRFPEDGFVHCSAGAETTLAVADDYFGKLAEPLVVLAIEVARLTHPVRFEVAAPISGGGEAHLEPAALFPHLYGPVNLDAVTGVEVLPRALPRAPAGYRWPAAFEAPLPALARYTD